jgi:tetratricopeptide (TPR) repeat protein
MFVAINKKPNTAVDRIVTLLKHDVHYTEDYYDGERIIPFVSILANIYDLEKDATVFTERKVASGTKDYTDLKHLGDLHYNQNEYEKALEYYAQIPREYMTNLRDRMSYANALYQTGRYDEAWEAMLQIARDTSFLALHFRMGNIKLMSGNADSAVQLYKEGVPLTPDTASYLVSVADNLLAYSEYRHSVELYRLAYGSNPENIEAEIGLGLALQKLGYLDSAGYYLKDVQRDHPGNYEALLGLAVLLYDKEDYDSSLKVLAKADQLHPEDFGIQLWLGNNYRELGKHNEALRAYQLALSIYPNHVQTRHFAALELYRTGDLKTALEQWNQVLILDSLHTGALLGITRVHDKLNNISEAHRALVRLQQTGFDLQSDSAARRLARKYLNEG